MVGQPRSSPMRDRASAAASGLHRRVTTATASCIEPPVSYEEATSTVRVALDKHAQQNEGQHDSGAVVTELLGCDANAGGRVELPMTSSSLSSDAPGCCFTMIAARPCLVVLLVFIAGVLGAGGLMLLQKIGAGKYSVDELLKKTD